MRNGKEKYPILHTNRLMLRRIDVRDISLHMVYIMK